MTAENPKRRAGGRKARHEVRAAPIPEADRPIRPGQIGGRYKPLTDAEVERIHHAVLDVLERIGMGMVPKILADQAIARGCHLNDRGRLSFPRAYVEDVIAGAGRNFTLHGRNPQHDIEITDQKVHYGTGGAAVRALDLNTGKYRPSTLADLYDFARLADRMENVSWFTRCVIATDISDMYELDINTAYAIAAGTTKPVGTAFSLPEHVAPVVDMFDAIMGGEGKFRARPCCKVHISPVVSPLRYGDDALMVALAAMDHNMPINSIMAPQAGATAPAPLAGMLVQSVAETLAGLLMINVFRPGYPMIFSNWPFVIDLRTGSFSGSGGEISLLNAAAAQIANHYDLPSGVCAGMADSKVPDAQAGYEKAMSTLSAGLAGANMVYESAGMFASLIGASFEGFVVDNEMLGMAQRIIRGIEVTDETIGLHVIEEVVHGAGHFLGHDHTVGSMIKDYLYPDLGDRLSPDVWELAGSADMRERARWRTEEILGSHFPNYIDAATDAKLREQLPIRLPRERLTSYP